MDGRYAPRLVDPVLADLVSAFPAVMIVGPRAVGKTTTARRFARSQVRLDAETDARAFRADPDAALGVLPEPVLIDEWQAVPGVLGAVKRAVDASSRPGRFIITGSVRGDLDAPTWPGTGRIIRIAMYGLTVGERLGRISDRPLLDRLVADGVDAVLTPTDRLDLYEYLELAVSGGFPEPVFNLSPNRQRAWLTAYLDQLVTRDATEVDDGRDPDRLRRYLEAVAANTAGVLDHKTLYDAAGISRTTGVAYEQLLRNLLVLDAVPPWLPLRLKRLTHMPKRYLTDCSLPARLLRVDAKAVLRSGQLIGRFLDTFVASQLRAEVARCECEPRLYHVRQMQGRHEIDLVAEVNGDQIVAVEVKAGAPTPRDARHLEWLRDELGDRFRAGIILHTGPFPYRLGDRIVAAPIAALWSSGTPMTRPNTP